MSSIEMTGVTGYYNGSTGQSWICWNNLQTQNAYTILRKSICLVQVKHLLHETIFCFAKIQNQCFM